MTSVLVTNGVEVAQPAHKIGNWYLSKDFGPAVLAADDKYIGLFHTDGDAFCNMTLLSDIEDIYNITEEEFKLLTLGYQEDFVKIDSIEIKYVV